MNIVWLSWKDRMHPLAGGAETVSGQIMERLVRDGHPVRHITALYAGAQPHETIGGVEIFRTGNRYTVYLNAKRLFKKSCAQWADIVIDEMNTLPFASGYYAKQRNVLLAYQLARKVWLYQAPFPISVVGYLLEPLYLRLIVSRYPVVLTESESTRRDMVRYGFKKSQIQLFRIGMALKPVDTLSKTKPLRTILSLGAVRPMKRTIEAVKAFETARDTNSDLRMVIAGDTGSSYARRLLKYISNSRHGDAIAVKGRVSGKERIQLMRSAAVILVTSVKEGWGLIVTEANSQGTPAIVYDTDGLRDSVRDGETGIIVRNGDYMSAGRAIIDLLHNRPRYTRLQKNAWAWSKEFTFENSYQDFLHAITG